MSTCFSGDIFTVHTTDGWCLNINQAETAYAITRTPMTEDYAADDNDVYVITREPALDVVIAIVHRQNAARIRANVLSLSGVLAGMALVSMTLGTPHPLSVAILVIAALAAGYVLAHTGDTPLRVTLDSRLHTHISDNTRVTGSRLIGPTAMTVPLVGHEEVFRYLDDRRAGTMLSRFDADTPFRRLSR